MVDDATDTVADMATDAYEGLQTLNQEYALAQRGMGALKTLGGVGEAFIGSVGIVAPEPATTVGGAVIFAHGTDVAWSGIQEMWYGKPVETLTDQAVTEGAKLLGADEATAKRLGDNTDLSLSLGSAGVGAYQVLTRPAIAQLEPIAIRPQTKRVSTQLLNSQLASQKANAELIRALKQEYPSLSNREIADLAKPNFKVPEIPFGFTTETFDKAQVLIKTRLSELGIDDLSGFATGSRVTGVTTNPKKTARFGLPIDDFSKTDLDLTLITSRKLSKQQIVDLSTEFNNAFGIKLDIRNISDVQQLNYVPIFGKIDLRF
jgi:hypothetical protein